MLTVNEIFYSIQGESTYAGWPCVFIRLTGCNLRCRYCDTTYAYDQGEDMALDFLVAKVEDFRIGPPP
jgi:7-carboxy-7-deazaguanine synthase